MLSLDLARLKKVAARLGCGDARGFGRRQQLHQLNRALGERLAGCTDEQRSAMAQTFVEAEAGLPAEVARPHGPVDAPVLEVLREKGCLDLGRLLGGRQAADIEAYLRPKPVLVGSSPGRWQEAAASIEAVPPTRNFACHDTLDLWSSPHLLEFATQDKLLDLAQAYLGCTPTLTSLNAYWALPERAADPQLQAFHRDIEDCRSLAIFTSLTSVDTPEEGARYYVETSHDVPRLEAALRADGVGTKVGYLLSGPFVGPMTMRLFGRSARHFQGPAGSSLCIDPYGLHRTVVPRSRPQLMLELRFGTFFNEAIRDMELVRYSGLRRALRRTLSPPFHLGAGFSGERRERARQALQRLPATPRHRYCFRYLIQALTTGP